MAIAGILLLVWFGVVVFHFLLPWSAVALGVVLVVYVVVALYRDGEHGRAMDAGRDEFAAGLVEHETAHREISRELLRKNYDDALRRMDEILAEESEDSPW